jgi:hypothetical protein
VRVLVAARAEDAAKAAEEGNVLDSGNLFDIDACDDAAAV